MSPPEPSPLVLSGGARLPADVTADLNRLVALGTRVRVLGPAGVEAPAGVEVLQLSEPATGWAGRVRRLLRRRAGAAPSHPATVTALPDDVTTVLVLAGGEPRAAGLLDDPDRPDSPQVVGSSATTAHLNALVVDRELAVLHQLDQLVPARRGAEARRLTDGLGLGAGSLVTSTAAALLGCLRLTEGPGDAVAGGAVRESGEDVDVTALATAALAAADEAWLVHPGAVYALSAAIRLLFHPVLHAEVAAPPLARDPEHFLAPLRRSTMFGQLTARHTGPDPDHPHVAGEPGPPARPPRRVLVLTGAYPRFAEPLVRALRAEPGLDVAAASLGEQDKVLNWLGPNTRALALRVADHPGAPEAPALSTRLRVGAGIFDGVDVVVAEWADRGAMWVSTHAPPGVRLVVRCHGVDVMSPWAQLIDWSRVDDVVFVSAPLRDLASAVIGERLEQARLHVVEHGVDAQVFDRPGAPGRERTLGMIGWGRVVKDPCWTLDVLAELVRDDPSWRLLLVGHPLDPTTDHRAEAYATELERRLSGPLAAHVERVAQTDDVAAQAARMGFVISSSLRESFHLGLLEGVFAGAVPVVRDWPVYQGRTGPRGLYPDDWVVSDPAAAVARITALATPDARTEAATRARAQGIEAFSQDRFATRIRSVVLGSPA